MNSATGDPAGSRQVSGGPFSRVGPTLIGLADTPENRRLCEAAGTALDGMGWINYGSMPSKSEFQFAFDVVWDEGRRHAKQKNKVAMDTAVELVGYINGFSKMYRNTRRLSRTGNYKDMDRLSKEGDSSMIKAASIIRGIRANSIERGWTPTNDALVCAFSCIVKLAVLAKVRRMAGNGGIAKSEPARTETSADNCPDTA